MLRTEGNYDANKESDRTGLKCKDPSLTVQEQAHEADINNIVRSFGITGKLPENVRVPEYGDFTGVSDYREALMAIESARESFMQMPSAFRFELGNDPQRFLEFCSDPANGARMLELGLRVAPPAPPPAPAPEA